MTTQNYNFRSLTSSQDPEYYAEAFDVFAQHSAKYQVLATWADTIFPQMVVEKLSTLNNNGQEEKLRVLGIGSGTGGMDCKMINQLLKKFPSISNTVIEPSLTHIEKYKKLVDDQIFGNVECDWRQQTWEEFYNEYKQNIQVRKFHFISAIHSLYYIENLETTVLNLMNCLEEGGILLMILTTDKCGKYRLYRQFPGFESDCHVHSGVIRNVLDKESISYEAITQESFVDITCCNDEENNEGILLMDFLTHVFKFRETAPKSFVEEVLAYMQGAECSIQEGEKIFFNNDWEAICVSK